MTDRIFSYINDHKTEIRSAFLFAFLAHGFAFTNIISNYDNYVVQPTGFGTGVTLGRWLLQYLGDHITEWGGNYNLSFFNGMVTIAILLPSICIITDLFQLNSWCRILFAGAYVTFPAITSTFFFMYTAPYYALAILFAALSCYFARKHNIPGAILSVVFIVLSLGIYQGYLPLVAALYVLTIMQYILTEKDRSEVKAVAIAFYYLAIIVVSFVVYMQFVKFFLSYYDTKLSTYVGIDQMGTITISSLIQGIISAFKKYYTLPFKNYYGVSYSKFSKVGILISILVTALSGLYLCMKSKLSVIKKAFFLLFLFIILPIAVMSCEVAFCNTRIYTIMIFGVVSVFLAPCYFVSEIGRIKFPAKKQFEFSKYRTILDRVLYFGLALVMVSNIYLANVNYTALKYCDSQVENYYETLVTQIKSLDGYDPNMEIALIGDKFDDPSYINPWAEGTVYGGNPKEMINTYTGSKISIVKTNLGYNFNLLKNQKKLAELAEIDEIKDMPSYPYAGSIKIVNNFIIIKLN